MKVKEEKIQEWQEKFKIYWDSLEDINRKEIMERKE